MKLENILVTSLEGRARYIGIGNTEQLPTSINIGIGNTEQLPTSINRDTVRC